MEGFEGNLILVKMIVKSTQKNYSWGLGVHLKFKFWEILAQERGALESWFFDRVPLNDLYLLGLQYVKSTRTHMYWPLKFFSFV